MHVKQTGCGAALGSQQADTPQGSCPHPTSRRRRLAHQVWEARLQLRQGDEGAAALARVEPPAAGAGGRGQMAAVGASHCALTAAHAAPPPPPSCPPRAAHCSPAWPTAARSLGPGQQPKHAVHALLQLQVARHRPAARVGQRRARRARRVHQRCGRGVLHHKAAQAAQLRSRLWVALPRQLLQLEQRCHVGQLGAATQARAGQLRRGRVAGWHSAMRGGSGQQIPVRGQNAGTASCHSSQGGPPAACPPAPAHPPLPSAPRPPAHPRPAPQERGRCAGIMTGRLEQLARSAGRAASRLLAGYAHTRTTPLAAAPACACTWQPSAPGRQHQESRRSTVAVL